MPEQQHFSEQLQNNLISKDIVINLPDYTMTKSSNPIKDTNYNISLVTTSSIGCKDTIRKSIVILPYPKPNFNFTSSGFCTPVTVTFTNKSLNAKGYSWDFGNGKTSTEENPVVT